MGAVFDPRAPFCVRSDGGADHVGEPQVQP